MAATVDIPRTILLRRQLSCCLTIAALTTGPAAHADVAIDSAQFLKLYGDFRLRYENDWNSRQSDGSERPDRERVRIRGRVGLRLQPAENLMFATRLRTGSDESQQSPHITIADFDGNPHGDHDVLFDQWYGEFRAEHGTAWLGRREFPFWKQNELFWDDDATIAGMAATHRLGAFPGLELRAGAFALPDGGVDFNGWMGAGQIVFSKGIGNAELTLAGGLYGLDGESGAEFLNNGNGERDYLVSVASAQARMHFLERPLSLGIDYMHNFENYSATDTDPFTAANHDQNDGVVVQARLGGLENAGNWLAGYSYAYVQTLAVNASYAQDDWLRLGTSTQADASNFAGHEFMAGYAIFKNLNVVARLYVIEAIITRQDGNRFRLDLNFTF